ncbi:MAG: Mandelate racemase [Rhodospirillales bacterium]|nr:Mandelate racemase [Rhodospirillales bacterium]
MQLDVTIEKLLLKAPFTISGYTFTEAETLVVRLRQDGAEGRGEASGVYYLLDEPAGMVARIEAVRPAIEAGITREALRLLLPPGGARNAVDAALWEIEARQRGQPVWRIAGLSGVRPLVTTFTLGAEDPGVMAHIAVTSYAQARALKLKLTGDVDLDAERVRAIRTARPEVWIGVDANQGFTTVDQIERLMPSLVEARVALLEQPLPRGSEALLDGYRSPVPIAADESVQGLSELEALAGRFNVVNIKLDKSGGLTEALLMERQARRLGMKVMVGGMFGSSWAMAPAFVLGQLCDHVDLDAPLVLAEDRNPGVTYIDGEVMSDDDVWGAPVRVAA